MRDLNDMLTFARVVESNSFSEAARRGKASKSTISKAVSRLERALGVRLLNRSTRGLSLTEVGAAFYEHCARIAAEAAQAGEVVNQLQSTPFGVLKVTAPVAFGRLHIAPAAVEYLARYSSVKLDMRITDRMIDLVDEGYDLAIRIPRTPDPHLVGHRLAPVRRVLCATPEYFKRYGIPSTPQELQRHNCLEHTRFGSRGEWRLQSAGRETVVPIRGTLRINDDDVLSQAVFGGLGIALLPSFIIGRELESGRLQAVLQDYMPIERHIYAVHLPNPHLPMKVRSFIDLLKTRFGPIPYWDRIGEPWPAPPKEASGCSAGDAALA